MKSLVFLVAWIVTTVALTMYLTTHWLGAAPRLFLPGPTTDAHYQLEERCELCHAPGGGVRQDACTGCHAAELEVADDSHPASKFRDPRNADRVDRLDALRCVTCHVEHRPSWIDEPAVTMPRDYCVACHRDIADERPDHRGLGFATCTAAGCHNYHDNRALHEDYLAAHLDDAPTTPAPPLARSPIDAAGDALTAIDADAPADARMSDAVAAWAASGHAAGGVNCTGCHGDGAAWVARPAMAACARCHDGEVAQFSASRHGMRLGLGLGAMRVGAARRPMHAGAREREVTCGACHDAHRQDTRQAATDACVGCHADRHSRACGDAPHAAAGVGCATCHLPRVEHGGRIAALHDQNATLRPNEKMIRPVCGRCHGVGFAIDALADRALIDRCFEGVPAKQVESLDMVRAKRAPGPSLDRRQR